MKCFNCGTELLESMTKCPKCGYDHETGQIDTKYLAAVSMNRPKVNQGENEKQPKRLGRFARGGIYFAAVVIMAVISTLAGANYVSLVLWLAGLGAAKLVIMSIESGMNDKTPKVDNKKDKNGFVRDDQEWTAAKSILRLSKTI